jgi:hypothetical protein
MRHVPTSRSHPHSVHIPCATGMCAARLPLPPFPHVPVVHVCLTCAASSAAAPRGSLPVADGSGSHGSSSSSVRDRCRWKECTCTCTRCPAAGHSAHGSTGSTHGPQYTPRPASRMGPTCKPTRRGRQLHWPALAPAGWARRRHRQRPCDPRCCRHPARAPARHSWACSHDRVKQ